MSHKGARCPAAGISARIRRRPGRRQSVPRRPFVAHRFAPATFWPAVVARGHRRHPDPAPYPSVRRCALRATGLGEFAARQLDPFQAPCLNRLDSLAPARQDAESPISPRPPITPPGREITGPGPGRRPPRRVCEQRRRVTKCDNHMLPMVTKERVRTHFPVVKKM